MIRRLPQSLLSARSLAPVVAVGALALSGCQTQSPIQTDVPYLPADGVAVDLGSVQIRNLLVVADAKNGPGVLTGSVVNRGDENAQITFAVEGGAPVTVSTPAHRTQPISEHSQVQLSSVPADPGGLVTLSVQTATSGSNIVEVPVLPATGYYETLRPSAAPTRS